MAKKILFVQHAGLGGALVSLSQILKNLDRNKYEPFVLLLRNDSKAIELLQDCGVHVLVADGLAQFRHVVGGWSLLNPLSLYYSSLSLLRLRSSLNNFRLILEEVQPDLVYLNSLVLFHYASVAHGLSIPVILHVREVILKGLLGLRKRLHQLIIEKYVTRTIFIGEFEREQLGISDSGEVIPNYVDLCHWQTPPQPTNRAGTSSSLPPTFLFVGGFNKIKGLSILLQALAILKAQHPTFRCVILGCTPPSPRMKRIKRILSFLRVQRPDEKILNFIQQAELSDNCILKPFMLDPVSEYTQADVLIFPATVPHFPRPVIEAGAMGLPVVVSDLPGLRNAVLHGQTGLLVTPNDPAALAEALLELLSHPELRKEMGTLGRQVVIQRYNGVRNGACILNIIEQCIQEQK